MRSITYFGGARSGKSTPESQPTTYTFDGPWLELCPVCHGEDTQIPPCAWCDGELYVEHSCPDA